MLLFILHCEEIMPFNSNSTTMQQHVDIYISSHKYITTHYCQIAGFFHPVLKMKFNCYTGVSRPW